MVLYDLPCLYNMFNIQFLITYPFTTADAHPVSKYNKLKRSLCRTVITVPYQSLLARHLLYRNTLDMLFGLQVLLFSSCLSRPACPKSQLLEQWKTWTDQTTSVDCWFGSHCITYGGLWLRSYSLADQLHYRGYHTSTSRSVIPNREHLGMSESKPSSSLVHPQNPLPKHFQFSI